MAEPALQLASLTKRFGALTAVDAIDLTVAPGEFVTLREVVDEVGSDAVRFMITYDFHPEARIDLDERHEVAAVLHHVAAARHFDLGGFDFLEPRHQ